MENGKVGGWVKREGHWTWQVAPGCGAGRRPAASAAAPRAGAVEGPVRRGVPDRRDEEGAVMIARIAMWVVFIGAPALAVVVELVLWLRRRRGERAVKRASAGRLLLV